jgi:DNA-binding NtrC family response regulator
MTPTTTTILLVDDEEPVLNALERVLKTDGYRILKVTDPAKALEIVQNEPVDVVISDHLMPGMKGLDLLREIKRARPGAIRILLTGHADLQMAVAAINQGEVYRFFQKPWDDATLRVDVRIAVIQRRLERENDALKTQVAEQAAVLTDLERRHPGISVVKRSAGGAIVVDEEDL